MWFIESGTAALHGGAESSDRSRAWPRTGGAKLMNAIDPKRDQRTSHRGRREVRQQRLRELT
jgi:hypothetical protein